jgi:E3 SUMO-protein ligase NSE2
LAETRGNTIKQRVPFIRATMPVASRRSRAAQPVDDIDEQPTQASGSSSRKANGKASKKGKAPKRQVGSEDEDEDMDPAADDGDDDDIIDVENFPDHPIRHADLKKLQNIVDEWDQTMALLGPHASNLGDIGAAVADAAVTEKDKKVTT